MIGQFYIGYAKSFIKKKSIILSGSSKGILISKNKGIDVNTQEDWNKLKKFCKLMITYSKQTIIIMIFCKYLKF